VAHSSILIAATLSRCHKIYNISSSKKSKDIIFWKIWVYNANTNASKDNKNYSPGLAE